MEPALKQRLLGAAVLIALAIIFLPMVFDGPAPPAPPAASLPLGVPAAPDRPLQTREIPLALPTRTPPVASSSGQSMAAPEPDRLATVDVPVTPRPDALAEAAPTGPARQATAAPPVASSAAPVPAAIAPIASAPTAVAPAAVTPAAPVAAAPLPAGSRYAVNLGSYSNAANASALIGRLKSAGVESYAETIEVDGKPAARVRAGPFASRAAAESAALAARRVQSDLSTAVVALESTDSAPARPAPAVAGGFVVQVAAFKSEAEANTLRDRLRVAGYATFVERIARDGGSLWRVRVGPEIQRAKADETRAALRQRFQLDGQVLTYP